MLDYVANMRVKTPTAAAEWLIARGEEALGELDRLAQEVYRIASDVLAGSREQLARIAAVLPHLPATALGNARARIDRLSLALGDTVSSKLRPEASRLDVIAERLVSAPSVVIERQRAVLDRLEGLVKVLSPQATLARGYSITRVGGHAVTSATSLTPGTIVETILSDGVVRSTVG